MGPPKASLPSAEPALNLAATLELLIKERDPARPSSPFFTTSRHRSIFLAVLIFPFRLIARDQCFMLGGLHSVLHI